MCPEQGLQQVTKRVGFFLLLAAPSLSCGFYPYSAKRLVHFQAPPFQVGREEGPNTTPTLLSAKQKLPRETQPLGFSLHLMVRAGSHGHPQGGWTSLSRLRATLSNSWVCVVINNYISILPRLPCAESDKITTRQHIYLCPWPTHLPSDLLLTLEPKPDPGYFQALTTGGRSMGIGGIGGRAVSSTLLLLNFHHSSGRY